MHKRPLLRIGNAMAKNFMGDRGNISLAKNQKAEHVSDGVTFCPVEIYMWQSAGYALGTAGLEARKILYRPTQMPVTRKEASKSEESTRSISRKSNCSLERRLCAIRASASRDSYSSTERCTGRCDISRITWSWSRNRNSLLASSSTISRIRSSVERKARETRELTIINPIKMAAILIPSGR